MVDTAEFIENFLQHADPKRKYDPAKAREYYLRTRKLKGRKKLMEDDPSIPETSPKGGKIKDFRDGVMYYTDGSSFSANGWSGTQGPAKPAAQRVSAAQTSIDRARQAASKLKGPEGERLRKRVDGIQARLNASKKKLRNE